MASNRSRSKEKERAERGGQSQPVLWDSVGREDVDLFSLLLGYRKMSRNLNRVWNVFFE